MTVAEKTEIRHIVLEVLQEVSERSGPPDRLMLFLYQFTGEFKEFRREMLDFKATTEDFHREMRDFKVTTDGRLDKVDARLDKVDARFDKVDARFDKVDERFDNIEKNMFTKTDWETEKFRLIEGIGVEFRRIVKEGI
jgi:hypothetical protein